MVCECTTKPSGCASLSVKKSPAQSSRTTAVHCANTVGHVNMGRASVEADEAVVWKSLTKVTNDSCETECRIPFPLLLCVAQWSEFLTPLRSK